MKKIIWLLVILTLFSLPAGANSTAGRTYQAEQEGLFRYIIAPGDTFYELSQRFGTNLTWLQNLNHELDPHNLQVGEEVLVSREAKFEYKVVESGNTLWGISQQYEVDLEELIELNRLENPDYLLPGEIIFLYEAEYLVEAEQIKIRELKQEDGTLFVSGLARVFEATVNYALETEEGEVLEDGFTTATTGGPGWGEFEIELDETLAEADYLAVFNISAKDGSRENQIKLKLENN